MNFIDYVVSNLTEKTIYSSVQTLYISGFIQNEKFDDVKFYLMNPVQVIDGLNMKETD